MGQEDDSRRGAEALRMRGTRLEREGSKRCQSCIVNLGEEVMATGIARCADGLEE
jgi:predicted adenine nucleotide alpha hydrolase (AANH) superfamily ATPase